MDPIRNPYTPRAGTQRSDGGIARRRQDGVARSAAHGRWGHGMQTLWIEAPEDRSLPAILAPELRRALMRVSRNARGRAKSYAERMFEFPKIGPLTDADARRAIREPAMAELGPGPHRSGAVAEILKVKVSSLGPTRSQLIAKGMVWSPSHGDTAFTVPLFDAFMRRIMPGDAWRKP